MRSRITITVVVALLSVATVVSANGLIPGPTLSTYPISVQPPTIDGIYGADEWPWAPQIVLDSTYRAAQYPSQLPNAPAYATFATTGTDLYILVDLPGDTTQTLSDECLFLFGGTPSNFVAEITGTSNDSLGGARAIGFGPSPNSATNHRIFEFRIPLSAIGAAPNDTIPLASPFWKGFGFSMGYDGSNGHDNIWPPNLNDSDLSDHTTWASLVLQDGGIPTLSEWALLAMGLVMGVAGFVALRKI